MRELLSRLADGEILVSDGAMGTLLQSKGLKPGECPELWNITNPNVLMSITNAYIESGSDIVETNSFGGTRYKLKEFGLMDRVYELNIAAVKLAKSAAQDKAYVAASVGPSGQIAEEEGGLVAQDDLYDAFREQIFALKEGGADAICIETMSSIIEAAQAIRAAKDITTLPVICTFTFELGARGYRTMMGVDPIRAAQEAIDAGADIVGANCGNGIENMIEITRLMHDAVPEVPIMIQANAGMPVLEDGKAVFKDTPEQMAARVMELIEKGANIIGGCCGTTPEHIRAIARVCKSVGKRSQA